MSFAQTFPATDLTANHLGERIFVTTLTGVMVEDVLAEVRYTGTSEPQAFPNLSNPQVWVRFENTAPPRRLDRFESETDRGFFVAPKSLVSTGGQVTPEAPALISAATYDEPDRLTPRD